MWFLYTLLACLCFGVGAALQKHGMATALPRLSFSRLRREWRVILRTCRRNRVWLQGLAVNAAGGLLMLLAIDAGEISVVQPLANINLLVALGLGLLVLHERLSRVEGAGALTMVVGAALVSASALGGLPRLAASGGTALLAPAVRLPWIAGGCALLVGLLNGPARLLRRLQPELLFAASAGLLYGLGTVLIKVLTVHAGLLAAAGQRLPELPYLTALAADPALWGIAAVNLGGFLFLQLAFSHGRVAIVSPVTAISAVVMPLLAGVLVFGEAAGPLRLAGIAVVLLGVVLLVLRGTPDAEGPAGEERETTEAPRHGEGAVEL